jgi:hypothetical protein
MLGFLQHDALGDLQRGVRRQAGHQQGEGQQQEMKGS